MSTLVDCWAAAAQVSPTLTAAATRIFLIAFPPWRALRPLRSRKDRPDRRRKEVSSLDADRTRPRFHVDARPSRAGPPLQPVAREPARRGERTHGFDDAAARGKREIEGCRRGNAKLDLAGSRLDFPAPVWLAGDGDVAAS